MAYAHETHTVRYTVELDKWEAGYLLDVLNAHLGGKLTLDSQPLGAIRVALEKAGAKRILAQVHEATNGYAVLSAWESE